MNWNKILKEVPLQEILDFCGLSEAEVLEILIKEGYIAVEDIEAMVPLTAMFREDE